MPVGTELKAVKAGILEKAGQEYNSNNKVNGAGLAVLLRIDRDQRGADGIKYIWYFHLSSLSSEFGKGDHVEQGDIIGYSGGCVWLGSEPGHLGVPSWQDSSCPMCESNGVLQYFENGPFAFRACEDVDGIKAHGDITSGNSTGPHLHYEMKTTRWGATYVDPAPHLTYPPPPA
jgi:hypothetical protein